MLSQGTVVRTIGLREVQAKADLMAIHLFENNWEMVKAMGEWVKVETEAVTPEGPGHFGYHLRDTFQVKMSNRGWSVHGQLTSAVQGYWREYGTKGRSRKLGKALGLGVRESSVAYMQGGLGGGGERAFMPAHKALTGARRLIRAFYSKALWWRL